MTVEKVEAFRAEYAALCLKHGACVAADGESIDIALHDELAPEQWATLWGLWDPLVDILPEPDRPKSLTHATCDFIVSTTPWADTDEAKELKERVLQIARPTPEFAHRVLSLGRAALFAALEAELKREKVENP